MSDNSDFTPELTLTPDLSAGTAAAQAPELTLTPDQSAADAAAAQKASSVSTTCSPT